MHSGPWPGRISGTPTFDRGYFAGAAARWRMPAPLRSPQTLAIAYRGLSALAFHSVPTELVETPGTAPGSDAIICCAHQRRSGEASQDLTATAPFKRQICRLRSEMIAPGSSLQTPGANHHRAYVMLSRWPPVKAGKYRNTNYSSFGNP